MNLNNKSRGFLYRYFAKWSIGIKTIPVLIFVGILKFLAYNYGLELMVLNTLFSSLIAGTIFLIGFLLTGVLSDFKESERIPSEVAGLLKEMEDDNLTISRMFKTNVSDGFSEYHRDLSNSILGWLYKNVRTSEILSKISAMNDYLVEFHNDKVIYNYIIRLKNSQSRLRQLVLRIDTIRDTDFVGSAYAIVEAMGIITSLGLIVLKIEPFYAALGLTLIVTFLISYMVRLIKDLDNPFEYSKKGEKGTEVSLVPLHNFLKEINKD